MARLLESVHVRKLVLSRKAETPSSVTLFGMVKLVSPVFLNALLPIVVTVCGSVICVSCVWFSNASLAISTTLAPPKVAGISSAPEPACATPTTAAPA